MAKYNTSLLIKEESLHVEFLKRTDFIFYSSTEIYYKRQSKHMDIAKWRLLRNFLRLDIR